MLEYICTVTSTHFFVFACLHPLIRLSFVTELVAEHTNETIGALLNATFGNMPELLISKAALRNGFYRIVQLTLLGSILTNLLFVFGFSCLVGGLQWHSQTIRVTSGNVSVGMLLVSTMGIVLPAVLKLANESKSSNHLDPDFDEEEITESDIAFSRFNSLVMVTGYFCFLIFQLGSHKEEFDYDGDEYTNHRGVPMKKDPVRRNRFCKKYCFCMRYCPTVKLDETNHSRKYNSDIEEVQYEFTDMIIDGQKSPKPLSTIRRSIPQSLEANEQIRSEESFYHENCDEGVDEKVESIKKLSCKLSDVEDYSEEAELEKVSIMSMRVSD